MSVRFFKILAVVLLAHCLLLSLVWIGFSAPAPRLAATFTYEGALPAGDDADVQQEVMQKNKTSNQFIFDHQGSTSINHWIELRSPSKPLTYDHLAF